MTKLLACKLQLLVVLGIIGETLVASETDALSTRRNFTVNGHQAFTMIPAKFDESKPIPWVWYAPTLGKGLPGSHEAWMFNRLHEEGIAIAGIDIGESYGSPQGATLYQALHKELTNQRGFAKRPVLLGRSRGGLMLYSWAARHPTLVAAIAGIYPVCNLTSYPGVNRAAPSYDLTPQQLTERLEELNPINMLRPLALEKTPILHIHGDQDSVVPLEPNSQLLVNRINAQSGNAKVHVIEGQGHNLWEGWFTNQALLDFMIKHARPNRKRIQKRQINK